MPGPTYVIGHRNPDADSICAAIAYAAFKKQLAPLLTRLLRAERG